MVSSTVHVLISTKSLAAEGGARKLVNLLLIAIGVLSFWSILGIDLRIEILLQFFLQLLPQSMLLEFDQDHKFIT